MNSERARRGGGRGMRRGGGSAHNLKDAGKPSLKPRLADDDIFDRFDDYEENFYSDEEDVEIETRGQKQQDQQKKPEKRKVEMQVLHMSDDSQTRVENALMELHGGRYKMREANSYKDGGIRLDRRFWVRDRQLFVLGMDQASDGASTVTAEAAEGVNTFALKKLQDCGFHPNRCIMALRETNGDVGLALEKLLTQCFNWNSDDEDVDAYDDETLAKCQDAMEDEKTALEAIYGDAFVERIPGRVWDIRLELPSLLSHLPKNDSNKNKGGKSKDKKQGQDVCHFFLRGHCKYGRRCRLRHVQPEQKPQKVDDKHLQTPQEHNVSYLEVRFPLSGYPRRPPLVCFRTELSHFPRPAALNITKRLLKEARELSKDEAPCVFTLVSLLESKDTVDHAVREDCCAFSFDEDFVPKDMNPSVSLAGVNAPDRKGGNDEGDGRGDLGDSRRKARDDFRRKMLVTNKRLKDRHRNRQKLSDPDNNDPIQAARRNLPAWQEQDRLLSALKRSQVVVVSGATGCGKSTQVPQFILDEWLLSGKDNQICNIICTQPRRISAIGVAERVAAERNEGTVGSNMVGYQIRMESRTCNFTRLLFCTTGILLRRLGSDPDLDCVSHVVVDEVHERSEEADFLLMVLRDLLARRKDLKVILMSATLNADMFADYFGGPKAVPVIEIPGRTFPVEQFFLEEVLDMTGYVLEEGSEFARRDMKKDQQQQGGSYLRKEQFKGASMPYLDDLMLDHDLKGDDTLFKPPKDNQRDEQLTLKQLQHRYADCSDVVIQTLARTDPLKLNLELIESAVAFLADGHHDFPREGSILVFLPGMQEISALHEQLSTHPVLGRKAGRFFLVPLHSSLSSEEQALVFKKPPKPGQRKIVLSTNLAETSITVDDCVFVIDAGKMREKRFDDAKNMESLDTVWVSRANALQRKGRAGRVRSGICLHLYTTFRFEQHFRAEPVPEIKRVPLEQLVLRIKTLPLFEGKKVANVVSKLLEAPAPEAVRSAVERLRTVGAMDASDELTPLGFHLASLPVDVRVGKLLLFGSVFRCVDAALTIAAALAYRSPFVAPFTQREQASKKKREFAVRNSDHLAVVRAYDAWREVCVKRGSTFAGLRFAQENFLSQKTLQTLAEMKHQFLELLSSIGFAPKGLTLRGLARKARHGTDAVVAVTGTDHNVNGSNYKLLAAVLCAALYPNVVQMLSPQLRYKQTASGALTRPPEASDFKFKTKSDGYVHLHPSSVCYGSAYFDNPYLVFHEKVKTSRVFVRELSMVPLYPMILFGGSGGASVQLHQGKFVLSMEDGWIKFVTASHKIAELLKEIRLELDRVLEEKIENPGIDLLTYPRGRLVIDTIVNVISTE